jgi:hypothetical protein
VHRTFEKVEKLARATAMDGADADEELAAGMPAVGVSTPMIPRD